VLPTQPAGTDASLAPEHSRFHSVEEEVAECRALLAEWQDRTSRFHQAMVPVDRELRDAWCDWVFALDRASALPGISRNERNQLDALVADACTALLASEHDDAIAAVLNRHRHTQPAEPPHPQALGEAGGMEAAQDGTPEWECIASAADAARTRRAADRRAAAALKARKAAERDASQPLRDVYRRLASALHPDREPDAELKARKTALMQAANEGYAKGHLLTLLELQVQAEQLDASRSGGVDATRLHHFVSLLQEQLAGLRAEQAQLESEFRAATGAPPGSRMQSAKADRLISAEVQRVRREAMLVRQELTLLRDVASIKDWLRQLRKE
jgi:hypothetical protein